MSDLETAIGKNTSQMRKGILEFCVLIIISKGKVYASDIIKTLQEVELIVVEGTLYPLLNRLKREGLLEYEWVESSEGPPRKYYSLSKKGEQVAAELTNQWSLLTKSIKSLQKQS
ncbi:MAG: PadR family transcriptional regulator [Candidatus Dojkabacteria bacterium]